MDYAAKHTDVLRKVQDKGVEVAFTSKNAGTYDPETDTHSGGGTEAVTGAAVELPADPEMYGQLELDLGQVITLFFVPDQMGSLPTISSSIQWAGKLRTVKQMIPYRPAGEALAAKVILE